MAKKLCESKKLTLAVLKVTADVKIEDGNLVITLDKERNFNDGVFGIQSLKELKTKLLPRKGSRTHAYGYIKWKEGVFVSYHVKSKTRRSKVMVISFHEYDHVREPILVNTHVFEIENAD